MIYKPHTYQSRAIEHIIGHRYCCLFLDMGLGKTVCTLTAIDRLLSDIDITRVLVIAPKRVAESVWATEAEKWDHTRYMAVSVVTGSRAQRIAALEAQAHVYVISRDNVQWLVEYQQSLKSWPFDMVVLDELSSFKNPSAKRFKALRRVRPYIRRVVGLTGTPSPNGLIDLWAQLYLVDMGQRLGQYVTKFRERYFKPQGGSGHIVYKWALKNERSADDIAEAIADICLSMKAEEYLDMPERIDIDLPVVLSGEQMKQYKRFERDLVLSLKEETITAQSAVTLSGKLMQYASGAIYDEDHNTHYLHDAKIEALAELMEQTNENVLLFYNYQHEARRIMSELAMYSPQMFDSTSVVRWNKGEIRLLLAHPASTAFGLNLQQGGRTVVWYGPQWNLELYQQANARLYRQGQTKAVKIYRIIAKGTIDERVVRAVDNKATSQDALLEAVKTIVDDYEIQ
jgi:SNF2 family DNA or RNA helicase